MRMRWTHNDSLAYQAFTDMGDRAKKGYDEAQQRQAFEQIQNAQPQEQYSPDQAAALQNASDAGYNVQYQGDPTQGGGYVITHPDAPGASGGLMTPGSRTFMGKQYDSAPTEGDMNADRANAMARYLAAHGNWKDSQSLQTGALQQRVAEQNLQQGAYSLADSKRKDAVNARVDKIFGDYQKATDPDNPDEDAKNRLIARGVQVYNQNTPGTNHDDGRIAHYDPESKQIIVGDMRSRTTKAIKLDGSNPEFEQNLMHEALKANLLGTSPEHWAQIKDMDRKDLQMVLEGRKVATGEKSADTQEQYRKDQHVDAAEKNRIAERVGMANANNRSLYTPSFVHAGNLPDGTPVEHDQHAGGFRNAITGKPLSEAEGQQLKVAMRLSGDKPARPVLSDAMNKDILEDYKSLKPGDAKGLGAFDAKFPGWRQQHGFHNAGLNLAPGGNNSGQRDELSPANFRAATQSSRGGPSIEVQPRINPQDWVKERARSLMGGGDRYRNIDTGETMSSSDYESRLR